MGDPAQRSLGALTAQARREMFDRSAQSVSQEYRRQTTMTTAATPMMVRFLRAMCAHRSDSLKYIRLVEHVPLETMRTSTGTHRSVSFNSRPDRAG